MVKRLQQLKADILRFFPERQLFLRSNNRVRYLTIPTPVQIVMATGITVALIWLLAATLQVILQSNSLEQREQVIQSINKDYLSLSNDFTALEKELERRASLIEDRQKVMDQMVRELGGTSGEAAPSVVQPLPVPADNGSSPATVVTDDDDDENAGDSSDTSGTLQPAAADVADVAPLDSGDRRKALLDRMIRLVDIQNRQATVFAALLSARSSQVSEVMGTTSVSLEDVYSVFQGPTGGPYVPDDAIKPVFDLGDESPLNEMMDEYAQYRAAMTAMSNVPYGAPSKEYYISSNFGRRTDPLKGTPSSHPGIDIAAWQGTPVLATAGGRVIFSGWNGPYGNMVDIDHGNGFKTRYGHMRKLHVKKGDMIEVGHHIGDVGDTGRTTGVHIHYEIWFKGRLQNPVPFLKVESDVRQIQNRYQYGEPDNAD